MASTRYEDALRHIQSLSRAEQETLLAEITERLEAPTSGPLSILQLRGLGKDLWVELDAQEYLDRERSSWDG